MIWRSTILLLCLCTGLNADLADQREQMKHRKRRIIDNDDGNAVFLRKHATPQAFLDARIEPALNTQVDSIFFCTDVTTLYEHDTDVGERMDALYESSDETGRYVDVTVHNMRMLRDAGGDCLAQVVKRCREAGVEVFFSHRINDIHDSYVDRLLSTWKREHPQYLICEKGLSDDNDDPRRWWTALSR